MKWNRMIQHVALLSAVLLCATAVWGQATTSLRGVVTDPSGAGVPDAKVTLTNADTNVPRQTVTTSAGAYDFASLLPGKYKLTVEAKGFNTYLRSGLELLVDLPATVNVQLQVGVITQIVEVTGQAPALNTTDASIGNTMGHSEIENLPLPGENSVLLLSLQPGVAYNGENILTSYYDSRAGMVNGERSDQNNISLDGVSNNDEFAGYAFNGILPTTPFSVEEFRVTTSNYGASEGRSSGAQMNLVTKGGTNNFHGSLYEFNRNTVGEANDYFLKLSQLQNNQPNTPEHLVWNNYGGTLGGPIWKDRFFFFFNYEGHRQSVAQSVERTIPSAALRDGVILYTCANPAQCTGTTVTGASGKTYPVPAGFYGLGPAQLTAMDPLGVGPSKGAMAYFQTYPLPNDLNYSPDAPNFAGYRFAAPTTTHDNWYITRLDYKLTQNGNHTLFFRGTGVDDRFSGAPFLPGLPSMTRSADLAKGFVAGYTAVLGTHWVNNFRYGLTRDSFGLIGNSSQPWVFMRDLDQNVAYSNGNTAPVHNWVDTTTWVKGSHSFQFGFNFLLSRLNTYNYGANFSDALTNSDWIAAGGFANKNDGLNPACIAEFPGSTSCSSSDTYPAVADSHPYDFPLAALMGIESEVDGTFNYTVGATSATQLGQNKPIVRHWAVDNYNLFAQDTWKVRPGLSVTYGLNYQLMTPMTETAGQQVTPTINIGDWFNQRAAAMRQGIPNNQVMGGALIGFGPSGSVYGKPGLYSAQTKNFAPRLGIAWTPRSNWGWLKSLLGQDKTVIRAGAGMYYSNFGPELAQSYSASGEFGLSTNVSNPSASLTLNNAPRIGSSLSDMNNLNPGLALLSSMGLTPPSSFTFPTTPPPGAFLIAHGIDQSLKTPYSYALDLSIQRELPGHLTLDVAYVGHLAHRLLVLDDVASPMDLVDPKTGIDYFAAAKRMSQLWRQGVTEATFNDSMVGPTAAWWQDMLTQPGSYGMCSTFGATTTTDFLLAVFDNSGPGCGSLYNETSVNYDFDVWGTPAAGGKFFPSMIKAGPYAVYSSQYSSLWAWRSIAWSNYNSLQAGLHKQMSHGLIFGFNYTYSKALDVESMSERSVHYLTNSVINAWNPGQMYGPGDADLRHQINGYWLGELPFGRGRKIAGGAGRALDAIIGGWQVGGTTRWTSGFPASVFMGYVWPTNWDEMGWADATGTPIPTGLSNNNGKPNIFSNHGQALQAFTYAFPGESGARNNVRGQGYFNTDMNLQKGFRITEKQSFQLRWSVFNVFNSVRFDPFSMQDEHDGSSTFGNYNSTLTTHRRMEIAGIYRF